MRLPTKRFRGPFVPPGQARIDWSHPLTSGLIGFFLPSATSLDNLAAAPVRLTLASAAQIAATANGHGITSLAANGGASVAAPAAFQLTGDISLFWLGVLNGFEIAGQGTAIGVSATNNDTAPFAAYAIDISGETGGTVDINGNSNGTFWQAQAPSVLGSSDFGKPTTLTATFVKSGTSTLFKNGASIVTSGGYVASPTYTTPLINFGAYTAVGSRILNAWSLLGGIWNRALSAQEVALISIDPTAFLVFPEDELFATLVGVTPIVATGLGALLSDRANARIGGGLILA